MKNMPLARKIYWSLSLAALVLVWGGQYRRHGSHETHYVVCECMPQCIFCAISSFRKDKNDDLEENWLRKTPR